MNDISCYPIPEMRDLVDTIRSRQRQTIPVTHGGVEEYITRHTKPPEHIEVQKEVDIKQNNAFHLSRLKKIYQRPRIFRMSYLAKNERFLLPRISEVGVSSSYETESWVRWDCDERFHLHNGIVSRQITS